MAKTLDFNTVNRPTLRLIMQDDDRTCIDVSTPTEALVEELQAIAPELKSIMQAQDDASLTAVYDLAARLMKCNRNGVIVSTEELRGKYRMDLESLIIFYGAYVDFIEEITSAKN